jgi:hypothetical protein
LPALLGSYAQDKVLHWNALTQTAFLTIKRARRKPEAHAKKKRRSRRNGLFYPELEDGDLPLLVPSQRKTRTQTPIIDQMTPAISGQARGAHISDCTAIYVVLLNLGQ